MLRPELPIPSFYNRAIAGDVWRVRYQEVARYATDYAKQYKVPLASTDSPKIVVMPIDNQLTFCHPDYELAVIGAIEDAVRFTEFGYRNLQNITLFAPTMDTHFKSQIFHAAFWVDQNGKHPDPMTIINYDDVVSRKWMVNPAMAGFVANNNLPYLEKHVLHYVKTLQAGGKYALIIWPYHAMLGGLGHALVPIMHEMLFFHDVVRAAGTNFEVKGGNFLTENYSIIAPEVTTQWNNDPLGQVNVAFFEKLMSFDYVIIAGQAKSHCVAWTIQDILDRILTKDPTLAKKIYLLEDCTSPVVVPGIVDFTQQANEAFEKFAKAGMNIVKSTTPMKGWPGMK